MACSNDAGCCATSYCKSGACVDRNANGTPCSQDNECLSNQCVDGVCCNTGCSGNCESCKLPGYVGLCTSIPLFADPDDDCPACSACNGAGSCQAVNDGTDPMSDCPQQTPFSCGLDGQCNGAGACRYWGPATVCSGQSCDASVLTTSSNCDGGGNCIAGMVASCCPYDCLGDSCGTSCNSDPACCDTALCKTGNACKSCSDAVPCPSGQWCCKGDSCTSPVTLGYPTNTASPDSSDGTYYSSTFGSTDAFEYASGSAYGSYATDRVFQIDTSSDTVGVSVTIKVFGTFNSVLYIKQGNSCASATNVAYNDDGCGLSNGGSCITMKLLPGQKYWVVVDGWGTNKGDFTMTVDYTTLCADCSCDTTYGEDATNNPVDCRDQADYCGNYRDITIPSKPYTRVFDDNLGNDRDDFSHWGSYTEYYNCVACASGDCTPPYHDNSDKVYRLALATTSNVYVRVERTGTWTSGNQPRLYIWKGDTCPGTEKRICLGNGNSYYQWGDWGSGGGYPVSGVQSMAAGTYWVMVDTFYGYGAAAEGPISAGAYRLTVTVW